MLRVTPWWLSYACTQEHNAIKQEIEAEMHKHTRRLQAEQVLDVLQKINTDLREATKEARDAKYTFETWKGENADDYDEGDPEYVHYTCLECSIEKFKPEYVHYTFNGV